MTGWNWICLAEIRMCITILQVITYMSQANSVSYRFL
jgi:hypothetical protein